MKTKRRMQASAIVLLAFIFTLIPFPGASVQAACTDRAAFVSDVNFADNSKIEAGKSFDKIWRLKNTGTCTWTTSYAMVFVKGDRMNGVQSVAMPKAVQPGATVDLKVALKAPSSSGTYTGYWQLRNANGKNFGLGVNANESFWVQIVVGKAGSSSETWRGEYFANRNLSGDPVLVRQDTKLDFNWGRKSPHSKLLANNFSARWTRTVNFAAGTYRFQVVADDGVRLWVDGKRVIDSWKDSDGGLRSADVTLSKGLHTIKLEYYENLGNARVKLTWDAAKFEAWKGEYFDNRKLEGSPVLVRDDRSPNFNWGTSAPAPEVPRDHFSVRWSRKVTLPAGIYRFTAQASDGVRVYIDGNRIINRWHTTYPYATVSSKDVEIGEGKHKIVIEFYERTDTARLKVRWEQIAPLPTPTNTPEPTQEPTLVPSATLIPEPTSVYSFVQEACNAEWRNAEANLACPAAGEDVNPGFVLSPSNPALETGAVETRASLLTIPQQISNGMIAGAYPAFAVQAGDHFKASLGCTNGQTACDVIFELGYRSGDGSVQSLANWRETHDGQVTEADVDLSALAGQMVQFVLSVHANGAADQDHALWILPRIMR